MNATGATCAPAATLTVAGGRTDSPLGAAVTLSVLAPVPLAGAMLAQASSLVTLQAHPAGASTSTDALAPPGSARATSRTA